MDSLPRANYFYTSINLRKGALGLEIWLDISAHFFHFKRHSSGFVFEMTYFRYWYAYFKWYSNTTFGQLFIFHIKCKPVDSSILKFIMFLNTQIIFVYVSTNWGLINWSNILWYSGQPSITNVNSEALRDPWFIANWDMSTISNMMKVE